MKADRSLAALFMLPRHCRRVGVIWLVLLAPLSVAAAEDQAATKRILILYSDTHDLPAFALLDQSLRETLKSPATAHWEIYSEDLDVNQFPGDEHLRDMRDYCRR